VPCLSDVIDSVTITVIPAAKANIINNDTILCKGDTINIKATPYNYVQYNWSLAPNEFSNSITTPIFTNTTAILTITASNQEYCISSATDSLPINIDTCNSVSTIDILLAPNPSNNINILLLQHNNDLQNNHTLQISVSNTLGQIVYFSVTDSNTQNPIIISGFASGIYFCKVIVDDGFIIKNLRAVVLR